MAAVKAAAEPGEFPWLGAPHEVAKIYYSARSKARMQALADAHERLGLENPFRNWVRDDQDDSHITTKVDVGDFFEARRDALLAHRTQVAPDGFWFRIPLEVSRDAYPYEDFTLANTRVPIRLPETDLFTGIPG